MGDMDGEEHSVEVMALAGIGEGVEDLSIGAFPKVVLRLALQIFEHEIIGDDTLVQINRIGTASIYRQTSK